MQHIAVYAYMYVCMYASMYVCTVQVTYNFTARCMSCVSHACGLIVFMCELYMPWPRMVIHYVYHYKLVTYAYRWA